MAREFDSGIEDEGGFVERNLHEEVVVRKDWDGLLEGG